jgi:hypothetical protein
MKTTIDLTPTWRSLLFNLTNGIKSRKKDVREICNKEIYRMALAADMYNATQNKDTEQIAQLHRLIEQAK